jgi:hypothetical protein
MTVAREQHDNHCIMNVDYRPWRIQWVRDNQMEVASASGETKIADLSVLNWEKYCADAAEWLKEESARLARVAAHQAAWRAENAAWVREEAQREKERGERELERYRREWQEAVRRSIGYAQLLASGYGPIEDLKDEVVLVDLEFTDARPILAVDCQTFHLERLTP